MKLLKLNYISFYIKVNILFFSNRFCLKKVMSFKLYFKYILLNNCFKVAWNCVLIKFIWLFKFVVLNFILLHTENLEKSIYYNLLSVNKSKTKISFLSINHKLKFFKIKFYLFTYFPVLYIYKSTKISFKLILFTKLNIWFSYSIDFFTIFVSFEQ